MKYFLHFRSLLYKNPVTKLIELYDSLGIHYSSIYLDSIRGLKITNIYPFQLEETKTCGWFVLYIIKKRFEDPLNNFDDFLRHIFYQNCYLNENLINNFKYSTIRLTK